VQTNIFVIDAAAVVFHLDENVIAAMVRAHFHTSLFGLPGFMTLPWVLETMRDCVAHKVNQRIGNVLNNIVVEFGFSAFQKKLHWFARCFGSIPHRPRKTCVQIADRHHAGRCDFVLQVVS
jgi:hypothetical protein